MTIQKGLLEAPATSKNIDIYLSLKHSLLTEGNFKWENASAVIVSQHICLIKTKKYKIHWANEGAILRTNINSISGCSKCYVISKSRIH